MKRADIYTAISATCVILAGIAAQLGAIPVAVSLAVIAFPFFVAAVETER